MSCPSARLPAPASRTAWDLVFHLQAPCDSLPAFSSHLEGFFGRGIYLTWAMQYTTVLSDFKGFGMGLASQCEGFQMCLVMQVIDRGAGMLFSISV